MPSGDQRHRSFRNRRAFLTSVAGVGSLGLAGCLGSGDANQSTTQSSTGVSVAALGLANEPVLGRNDAGVTMVYWGDFNCMYCYKFAQETFPRIRESYVQSGDLRVVYKNLITMGEDSMTLAVASQAAWSLLGDTQPDAYWQWHEQLSADQKERKQNEKSVMEDIVATTRKTGVLEPDKLTSTMETIDTSEIQADGEEASQRGIQGTPSFVVYPTGGERGTKIVGAQPFSKFESVISDMNTE
ncbi:MAG: DsbA family protein [Halanaeroarchaeum sp.]